MAGDIAAFMALSNADIERKMANGADVSKMKPHGPLPCTLNARLAKSKKGFIWHIPETQECSVPFTNLPAMEDIIAEINRFLTTKSDVESVAEQPGKKARAR